MARGLVRFLDLRNGAAICPACCADKTAGHDDIRSTNLVIKLARYHAQGGDGLICTGMSLLGLINRSAPRTSGSTAAVIVFNVLASASLEAH